MSIKKGLPKTKEGLPKEAFAIVGDPEDPDTWKLPHHTKTMIRYLSARSLAGKLDIEKTVDWSRMGAAVAALSPRGHRGQRVDVSPGEILAAAGHLANHYREADKPLPDTLAALI